MNLDQSALDFIAGSRWIEPVEAARELVNLAKHGCDWPKATAGQWLAIIDRLVDEGRLQRKGECVYLDVGDTKPVSVQLGLFD